MGKLRGAGRVLRGNSNSLSGFNLKLVSMNRLCADSEHAIYLKIYSGFKSVFIFFCKQWLFQMLLTFSFFLSWASYFLSCTHSNSYVSYDMLAVMRVSGDNHTQKLIKTLNL